MELTELINHPERLDRDTLYELRSMLALYPYFQTPRLLMLQNLYLLHDPAFDEELRRAAVYITDRKVIFRMIEAAHYQLHNTQKASYHETQQSATARSNRTVALIDTFLDSIPKDDEPEVRHRRPTPADAAIDYVAYLLETESYEDKGSTPSTRMKGQDLIDNFLEQEQGRIQLGELPEEPQTDDSESAADDTDEEYFTETLARIYIKQGRYQKALDIISRLSERFPNKNAYFADQIRFLEKLIINNSNNKQFK
ncbi:MAG: tetratricopeptide repeat protein [Prevotella sp.]|nr:tetratricopeptide repeat protein [Prevotella sp.]